MVLDILREDKNLVVFFDNNDIVSKVYNTPDGAEKALEMHKYILDNVDYITLELLLSQTKASCNPSNLEQYPERHFKFHRVQPRYQDARRIQKMVKEYKYKNNQLRDFDPTLYKKKAENGGILTVEDVTKHRQKKLQDRLEKELKGSLPKELEIPIYLDPKTTIYVKESFMYKDKFKKYFKDDAEISSYIKDYKEKVALQQSYKEQENRDLIVIL